MKCSICINNTYYNETLKKCTPCPAGKRFDSVLQKCIGDFPDVCPDDHPVYNAQLKRC